MCKLLKSVEETCNIIVNMEMKTNAGEDFVLLNNDREKIIGFSTK